VDFQLYLRVLWRFRFLVLLGVVLAGTLAIFSVVNISTNGLRYKQYELYSSSTRLIVTQQGFPYGRLLAQNSGISEEAAQSLNIPMADQNRLNGLTLLYAELATSDPVRRLMRRDGPISGRIIATPVVVQEGRYTLPLIDVVAIAVSPKRATRLAERAARAFETYLTDQQRLNKVPKADRVVVQQVERPRKIEVVRPRSKTLPIVIFFAVSFATIGLAFLLENMRPRPRSGASVGVPPGDAAQRRTA
jgi:hypothetical protein